MSAPAPSTQDEQPAEQADSAQLKRILEALLFSAERPVTVRRLAEVSGASDGREVRRVLKELGQDYDAAGHAFSVEEIAGGFQILTRPEYAGWITRLHTRQQQETLSKAALETLAIVAYRQPITRAEVDDIRGVQCAGLLRSLADRRLIKVVGRSPQLGRPLLYGTTKHFLQVFGLRSLKDLPKRANFGTLAAAPPPSQPAEAAEAAGPEDAEPSPPSG